MLPALRDYYDANGIGALTFACRHHDRCAAESPGFTTAKEAYVGPEYEAGMLPRLLFLSLDSGSADSAPATKTLEANREWMRGANVASFPKGRHWSETHELACCLLRPFKPDLTVATIGPYFAHTNSAKCCLNNPGHAVASETLFRSCRAFIPGEIRILRPDILVTQGDYARDAVVGAFEVEAQLAGPKGSVLCRATILRVTPTQRAIWFHSYHPSAYGLYWRQRNSDWPFFARAVAEFVGGHPPPMAGQPPGGVASVPPNRITVVQPVTPRLRPTPPPRSTPVEPRTYVGSGDPQDSVVAAFTAVFKVAARAFGTVGGRYQGVSDNAEGVQWNAGVERHESTAWLGVNLEGMAYEDWPVASFIERELDRPRFPDLCGTLPDSTSLIMTWTRDAWQAAARLPIVEIQLGATPITLDRLTAETWRGILQEAYACLDASRGHRGRALQTVTLKGGPAERYVSPHLHVHRVLWRGRAPLADEAITRMTETRTFLQPVYDFVGSRY
jgi:hypothetical protein